MKNKLMKLLMVFILSVSCLKSLPDEQQSQIDGLKERFSGISLQLDTVYYARRENNSDVRNQLRETLKTLRDEARNLRNSQENRQDAMGRVLLNLMTQIISYLNYDTTRYQPNTPASPYNRERARVAVRRPVLRPRVLFPSDPTGAILVGLSGFGC